MDRNQRSPNSDSPLENPRPRIGKTLKEILTSNILSHITSHGLATRLRGETNLKNTNDVGDTTSDIRPSRGDPTLRNENRRHEEKMENPITLRSTDA
jgi:hypothetical protein